MRAKLYPFDFRDTEKVLLKTISILANVRTGLWLARLQLFRLNLGISFFETMYPSSFSRLRSDTLPE